MATASGTATVTALANSGPRTAQGTATVTANAAPRTATASTTVTANPANSGAWHRVGGVWVPVNVYHRVSGVWRDL